MIDIKKISEQHEKLFPKATAESQFYKLEEEIQEAKDAITWEQNYKEIADIIIVCCGLYRWFPNTARAVANHYYDRDLYDLDIIDKEVERKWQVNLNRKYKHIGVDGNE